MRGTCSLLALTCLLLPGYAAPPAAPLGIFEDHADVGTVLHAGSVEYDASKRAYTIAGSGENMWFATDAFQFVWKKMSGDAALTADIAFIGSGGEAHRKAVLMIRQSLEADSAYADVARHGNGLTSLQARDEKGANTSEVQSAMDGPARVRIVKRGDQFYMWVAGPGEDLRFSGASMRVPLHDPFYVGIGVCSHDKDAVEKAVFSNVDLTAGPPAEAAPKLYSTLETVPLSGDRRITYVTQGRLSSPRWDPNGESLVFENGGFAERIPLAGGKPEVMQGSALSSGEPNGAGTGPEEQPLDPKLLSDGFRNIFAEFSPDGQQIAFLSFGKDVTGVPEDQEAMLRVISRKDGKVRLLATFVGGKGSGPSWSPDGGKLAFISYRWIR